MLPGVMLEIFEVRPHFLLLQQVCKTLQVTIPPENEDSEHEVGV